MPLCDEKVRVSGKTEQCSRGTRKQRVGEPGGRFMDVTEDALAEGIHKLTDEKLYQIISTPNKQTVIFS